MSWYYGTFSCNHEGRVNIVGPTKNRQWIADRKFEGPCEECYRIRLEEERQKLNEEAEAKAKEMELVELSGTEKQVAWANTLRQKMIEGFENTIELYKKLNKVKKAERAYKVMEYILNSNFKATFYIDSRFNNVSDLIEKYKDDITEEKKIEKELENQIIKEGTVSPEKVNHESIVEIRVTEGKIEVYYEKNYTFIDLIRSLKYKWNNGCWTREITETNGNYKDRAAELINELLNKGFIVSTQDEEIREKAINGDYEKECTRWIYKRKDTNKLAINWEGIDDKLYGASKRLPGARWSSPSMLVDISHYSELEEFAEMYGFKFTKKAKEFIEIYKIELAKVKKVSPAKVEPKIEKNGLEDILNSSRNVLEELLDD